MICTLVVACLLGSQSGSSPTTPHQVGLKDLRVIRKELEDGRLSQDARVTLDKAAKSPEVGTRHVAITLMLWAASRNLYPRKSIVNSLSALVKGASSGEASLLAREAADCYGISISPDEKNLKDWATVKALEVPPTKFAATEKTFILTSLKSRSSSNRALAGQALIRKTKLDVPNLKWAMARISDQRSKSTGGERSYWEFLGSALRIRNPLS